MWIWSEGPLERLHTPRLCLVCYKSLGQGLVWKRTEGLAPRERRHLVVD